MVEICKKYVWDSGEHNLQTDNYSYEIIDPYFEGCKKYDVFVNYEVKYLNPWPGPQNQAPCTFFLFTSSYRRQIVNGRVFNEGHNPRVSFVPGSQFSTCLGPSGGRTARFRIEEQGVDCRNPTVRFISTGDGGDVVTMIDPGIEYIEVATGQPPPIKLKIIDGGIESIYSINNKNSVQLIEYECGCPPNQLDCGDCCLDCNSIFNQISGIRALVRSLN